MDSAAGLCRHAAGVWLAAAGLRALPSSCLYVARSVPGCHGSVVHTLTIVHYSIVIVCCCLSVSVLIMATCLGEVMPSHWQVFDWDWRRKEAMVRRLWRTVILPYGHLLLLHACKCKQAAQHVIREPQTKQHMHVWGSFTRVLED